MIQLIRYLVITSVAFGATLYPGNASAVVKNIKVEISPVTETGYPYNKCKYYLPFTADSPGEKCNLNLSIAYWEILIDNTWKTYYDAYFLIPSYGDNAKFTGKGSNNLYWFESSVTPFFILTGVITQCPKARALANYNCVSSTGDGTGGCVQQQWFLDCDKDGVGDGNLVTAINSCTKPADKGTCGYATAKGDDCDFDPQTTKKYTYCVDADDDWWPSSVTAQSCNCSEGQYDKEMCKPLVGAGKPSLGKGGPPVGFAVCAYELMPMCTAQVNSNYCKDSSWGGEKHLCTFCNDFISALQAPTSDCDDGNPGIGGKQQYCADQDGDGYCCADTDKDGHCSEPPNIGAVKTLCPKAALSPYIPLASSKGPDACDHVKGMTVAIEECMDADGDGFGNPKMCQMHCYNELFDGWQPKTSGVECESDATHPIPDEDPTFNPKQKWVIDCDGDGYYPENLVKTGCAPPTQPDYCKTIETEDGVKPVLNYVLLESPEGKSLKPGDCADQWFKVHAQTTWGTDVDADGYYDISKNIVQCKDPDKVENQVYPQCADSADPDCAAKAKASPYKMLSKVDWKAGDCDDTDPVIHDVMWQFEDSDMDGRGDPLNSTVTHCADTATSDIPTTTTPAYGEVGVQYPMAKHPDDLTPHGEPLTRKIFFVTQTTPVPCEEQFKQGKTTCLVPGSICRYEPSPIFPDLSCLPEAFRSKYCPTFGTLYDGSEQPFHSSNEQEILVDSDPPAYSIDLSNLFQSGEIPFGTTRPILSVKQFAELAIMPTKINTNDLWPYYTCLYLDSFKKTSFFGGWLEVAVSPVGGWVNYPATTWAVLKLDPGSSQAPATSTQVFSLLAASGSDYTLALDAMAKPGYEKWNVPRVTSLPKATVAEVETPAFPTITTLDQLLQATKNLSTMPYPIPVIVKSGPKVGTIQCVYYGELYGYQTQCKFGHLSDPRHAPKLADLLAQKGVLPEEAANLTDSDGDKVTDVAEVNLPFLDIGMGAGFGQQIAMDATIKPVATGPLFENIWLSVNLTPEESALFNEAKKRALEILPKVFDRFQQVIGDYPNASLILTLPQWKARVQYAVSRWVWGPPALYDGTNYAINWGLSYFVFPTTALELAPFSKNAAGFPIVNLWLIQKYALQQGLDPIQAIANTMIHTIFNEHVVMDVKLLPLKKALIQTILEEWGGEVYIPSTPEILP